MWAQILPKQGRQELPFFNYSIIHIVVIVGGGGVIVVVVVVLVVMIPVVDGHSGVDLPRFSKSHDPGPA